MKILVTGANGFVGSHLCEKLLAEGHEVFALVRNSKKFTEIIHERLTVIQGDLDGDVFTWTSQLPQNLDSCVHTAGIVHSYLLQEFYRVNTEGTQKLIVNLKNKFKNFHFVLISSLAASGPSLGDEQKNESDMDFPVSVYGQSKKQAEEMLILHAPKEWITTIIRPPMVIGPKDSAVLDIFKMVKGHLILLPGANSKSKKYSFVCVFDLVETICNVLNLKQKGLFYSAHPQTITFNELILEIKRQLKTKWIIYFPMPLILVKFLTMLLNFFYRVRPHQLRLTPDKYHELAAINWTCQGQKSSDVLSQHYNYDLTRTITLTLLDYKSRKWI